MTRLFTSALFVLSVPNSTPAADYHLYYLGGQSNMDGYGRIAELPEELQGAVDGVMIFHGNTAPDASPVDGRGVWAELQPGHGVGYSSDGETGNHSDRFGVELTFTRRLRELYRRASSVDSRYTSHNRERHPARFCDP